MHLGTVQTWAAYLASQKFSFLFCERGLIMTWKAKMLAIVINVHAINPSYIIFFFIGTEPKNDSKGQRKGWEGPYSHVLHCLGAVNMASLILWWLDDSGQKWNLNKRMKSFQVSKLQPDIIINFSQWAKDLARLRGRVWWGRLGKEERKEASLSGAHKDM